MTDEPTSSSEAGAATRQPAGGDLHLPELNLPPHQPKIRMTDGRSDIFDPIRRQFVRLTPEEWVRQSFLQYLTSSCGYPAALTAVEKGFEFQQMARRADIVVHDRTGRPFLMVECKAPGVPITQSTFDQVSRYNRVIKARYLIVTNGLSHYCWTIEGRDYRFLDGPPSYGEVSHKQSSDEV